MEAAHRRICQKCGTELSDAVLAGQCPACMVQLVRLAVPEPNRTTPAPIPRDGQAQWESGALRYFGDFELLGEVGHGGMGIVYKARQLSLNRVVALKLIAPEQLASPKAVERFHTEAEAAANLDHPNIVPVYDTGAFEGRHYFSMKLIEGQSLAQRIDDFRLPIADSKSTRGTPSRFKSDIANRQLKIANLIAKVAEAVHYAHQRGILHRDLKPGNILIDNAGQPHVSDFGLARWVEAESSLTLSGEVLGTPAYMSPEQAAGKANQITTAADVYSLGGILYELLTDRPPFCGATSLALLHELLHNEPPAPHSLNRRVSRDLETVCLKCLEKQPARRYASAQALADDLHRFARHEPIQACPATLPEKLWRWCKRKPALAATLLLLHIVLAIGLAGILWQWRRAEENAIASRQNELASRESLYAADTNLAQRALEADNLRQARYLLEKQVPKVADPDLRGFEWRYLWRQSQSEELFNLPRHEGRARAVAVSGDGRSIATVGDDRLVRLWDFGTQRTIATLTNLGSRGAVFSVSLSPPGSLLAVGTRRTVTIWETRTYRQICNLPGAVLKAKFSPDGRYLATCSTNGLIVWNTSNWSPRRALVLGELWPRAFDSTDSDEFGFDFTPDGKRIGVTSNDGIKLLTAPDLDEVATLKDRLPRIRFIAFSPDGHCLAACTGTERDVKIWDRDPSNSYKESKLLSGHTDSIYGAAFSSDGERLATCGADQTLKLWDVASGTLLHTFKGHVDEIWDVTFTPDGKSLVSASKDGTVKVWSCVVPLNLQIEVDSVRAMGFNRLGDVVATTTNNTLITFNPKTLQRSSETGFPGRGTQKDIYFGELLCDGQTLSLASRSKIDLWDLSGQFISEVEAVDPRPAYAPNGRLLATATASNTVSVWQLPQAARRFVFTNSISPVAFSADEALLAMAVGDSGGVKLWRFDQGKLHELGSIGVTVDWVDGLAFSADGRKLAMGEWDGSVGVWTVPSGHKIATLIGHKRSGFNLCFSPDGRMLASVSDDRMVRLWYVATQQELMRFELPGRSVWPSLLEFSQDGQALICSGSSFTRVWHAPSRGELLPSQR